MLISCTISKYVTYNPPHHITQYWVFQSSHVYRRRTFTRSPVSDPRSAGMSHHPLHLVLIVHGSATAIAQQHVTRGVLVLVVVETNTVMCMHSGV